MSQTGTDTGGNPLYTLTGSNAVTSIAVAYTGQLPTSANTTVTLLSTGLPAAAGLGIVTSSAICFAGGTRILTDRGEVLVQDLKVGDFVVTPYGSNECMPVRWIGRQRFFGSRMHHGKPVLVRAGALGDGLPLRDLRVSGDHSLLFDGKLVPARLLVNELSIIVEAGHTEIEYYNLEFDRHTVIFAEGIEAESYLECGNRFRFDNGNEPCDWLTGRASHDASAWVDGSAFAPVLWEGPQLGALRARLAAIAMQLATPIPAASPMPDIPAPAFIVASGPPVMAAAYA